MATLTLKIDIPEQNVVKTMQFTLDAAIYMVLRDIREKIGETSAQADHGLFWPTQKKWLASNRTLGYYDVKTGDNVEYKKKHRPLKVRMMDHAIKTVLVDESEAVQSIVETICRKIGIANSEEYSLLVDTSDAGETASVHQLKKKDSKKALDDEEKWLSPEKTLPEQDVQASDTLLLKKKFFFSDQNVDRNDPVQLHLLYMQSRDAILSAKHPCTSEEATQFAALQCQVQLGNFEPDKHVAGYIKMADVLPAEYIKKKDMEKRIHQEHRKLQGLTELNAKFRYVQLCRSLKTYGVTFFMVKEKHEKKNKIQEILLGITRENIMRVDNETKEILKTWPLTQLRRWAASPNRFTLDFGDYESTYYSVQTAEGEQISQLISGYIDLILKKKKDNERPVDEEEFSVSISDHIVQPGRGMALVSAGGMPGSFSRNTFASSMTGNKVTYSMTTDSMQRFQESNLANTRQALMININAGNGALAAAMNDMSSPTALPPLGNDAASIAWKEQTLAVHQQNLVGSVGAILASTCSIVNGMPLMGLAGSATQYANPTMMVSSISTITSSIPQMAEAAKMVSALQADSRVSDRILSAGRDLALQTQQSLLSLQQVLSGVSTDHHQVYDAVRGTGLAGSDLLRQANAAEVTRGHETELQNLAEKVETSMLNVVNVGNQMDLLFTEPRAKEDLARASGYLKGCTFKIAPCVASAAVVSNQRAAQDALLESCVVLQDGADDLKSIIDTVPSKEGKAKLAAVHEKTDAALNDLALLISAISNRESMVGAGQSATVVETELDRAFTRLLGSAQEMLTSTDSPQSIVNSAREITIASTALVNVLKEQANQSNLPMDQRQAFLDTARSVADVTSQVVNAAKILARAPKDEGKQEKLKEIVSELISCASSGAGSTVLTNLYGKLAAAAKASAFSSTALTNAGKQAALSNRNQASQQALALSSKKMNDATGRLVLSAKDVTANPNANAARKDIVVAVTAALPAMLELTENARGVAATVFDPNVKRQLELNADKAQSDYADLSGALSAVNLVGLGATSLESALTELKQLQQQAQKLAITKPASWQLPLPVAGATADPSSTILTKSAQLIEALPDFGRAVQNKANKQASSVAQDMVDDMSALLDGLQLVARDLDRSADEKVCRAMAMNLSQAITELANMIQNGKQSIAGAATGPFEQDKAAVERAVRDFYRHLPGGQDVDSVRLAVEQAMREGLLAHPNKENNDIAQSSADLLTSGYSLVAASKAQNNKDVQKAVKKYGAAFQQLVDALSLQALYAKEQGDSTVPMEQTLQSTGGAALQLLTLIGEYSMNPAEVTSTRRKLNDATKLLGEAVAALNASFGSHDPLAQAAATLDMKLDGVKAKAETLEECRPTSTDLTKLMEAVNEKESACRSQVMPLPQALSNNAASRVQCASTLNTSMDAVVQLIEHAYSIAFVIAARQTDPQLLQQVQAPPTIVPRTLPRQAAPAAPQLAPKPSVAQVDDGLFKGLDVAGYKQAQKSIIDGCATFQNESAQRAHILGAAGEIAKATNWLCNSCKTSSAAATQESVRDAFLAHAKSVASATAQLVAHIKVLATQNDASSRQQCVAASKSLQEIVAALVAFIQPGATLLLAKKPTLKPSASSELLAAPTSVTFTFSPEARARTAFILDQTRTTADAAKQLLLPLKASGHGEAAEALPIPILQTTARALHEACCQLAKVCKDASPGQQEAEDAIQKISSACNALEAKIIRLTSDSDNGGETVSEENMDITRQAISQGLFHVKKAFDVLEKTTSADQVTAQTIERLERLGDDYTNVVQSTSTLPSVSGSNMDMLNVLEQSRQAGHAVIMHLHGFKNTLRGDPQSLKAYPQTHKDALQALEQFNLALAQMSSSGGYALNDAFANAIHTINSHAETFEKANGQTASASTPQKLLMTTAEGLYATVRRGIDCLTDSLTKTKSDNSLGPVATNMAEIIGQLVPSNISILASMFGSSTRNELVNANREVLSHMIAFVEALRASAKKPTDPMVRQKLSSAVRDASQSSTRLITATQACCKGFTALQECQLRLVELKDESASLVIFAEAGQLDPIAGSTESFNTYKDGWLETAKEIVDLVKTLVTVGISASQDDLYSSMKDLDRSVQALANEAKKAVTAITSSDKLMQTQCLQMTGSVFGALYDLLNVMAQGIGQIDAQDTEQSNPKLAELHNAAKQVVAAIAQLLKVIKTVGDEKGRAGRAIDSALADIHDALQELFSANPAQGTALPDEIVQHSKSIVTESARLVAVAGTNKQEDVLQSSGLLKRHVEALARASKAATEQAPEESKQQTRQAVNAMATHVGQLLTSTKAVSEQPTPANKAALQENARAIAQSAGAVTMAVNALVPSGYVDMNDPNVIAERDLLAAAAFIEAAAKKLVSLQPAEHVKVDESMNFEQHILEAAKAIASATGALLKNATGAQREIIAKGKSGPIKDQMYYSDGQWSEGLVSAAKAVAMATGDLCESANEAVKGNVERERVIVSAKGVNAATAQLLASATVRGADPTSQVQLRLRAAGKSVLSATDNLVKAAEESMAFVGADNAALGLMAAGDANSTKSKVQEMEAQMSVLKMEKDLEMARNRLAGLRKTKYSGAGQ